VLYDQPQSHCATARAAGEHRRISKHELDTATGGSMKQQSLCRSDVCVPVPASQAGDYVAGDAVNAAAFWRRMGSPVVHDGAREVWVLGTSASHRGASLQSLEAPDFTLPDLGGGTHRLSKHRGKKVLLATWASW